MWNPFKRNTDFDADVVNEVVSLSRQDIKDSLVSSGAKIEFADKFANSLYDRIGTAVKEKTQLTYDDFVQSVTDEVSGLYEIPSDRLQLCEEMERFAKQNPEVSNSIKLYASYIIYGAADIHLDEYKVIVFGEDEDEMKLAEKQISLWERRTKIRRVLFPLAKDLVAYGDAFLEKIYDEDQQKILGIAYIPSKTVLVVMDGAGNPKSYYQIVDKGVSYNDLSNDRVMMQHATEGKVIKFEKKEIAHFNDGSIVGFADTPMHNLLVLWRFLKVLEEALTIHKLTRARRFIIFFLDVTGKTGKDIRRSVQGFTNTIKSVFKTDIKSGSIYSNKSTIPASSDLVIPVTKDSATKVQTIPTDTSATNTADLKFYLNRLTVNMFTSHILSSEKNGKEEFIEKAFMRMVRIYQKQMTFTLEDLYNEMLFKKGFTHSQVQVSFPPPDTEEEIKIVDTIVRRMMIVNQLTATLGVSPPPDWLVPYIFKDLSQVEVQKLIEVLNDEIEKQSESEEGEEFPTIFDEGAEDLPEESEGEEQAPEEGGELLEKASLADVFAKHGQSTRVHESKISDMNASIKLGLEYLNIHKKQPDRFDINNG